MNKNVKTEILNYGFILLGSLSLAFGVVAFLAPNNIATGGAAGLAILLHYILDLPIGLLFVLVNVPLLVVGFKYLGKNFAVKTIISILLISFFVDVFKEVFQLPNLSNNLLLATLYGGLAIGVGLGLVFKGGASAGGGTILAKIIAAKTAIKTSTIVLVLDGIIVVFAGIYFKNIEISLWSLMSIFVAIKFIDTVLIGASNQKIVHISSSKNLNELSKIISETLGVTGTIVSGNSLGSEEYKDIIFLVIDKSRFNTLKQLVANYDENVKMIVMEATEVLGKETYRL